MNREIVPLYRDYSSYLKDLFGCRVHKITVDAGMTCPNRDGTKGVGGCVYCNARGSGTGQWAKGKTIRQQLEDAKPYLKKRFKAEKFLAYFQSFSNTYAPIERLRALYEEALSVEDVVGLTIGTRPDCVSEEILSYLSHLSRSHYVSIEYGLQSAHNETLKLINRGHSVETFIKALRETRKRNIPVCVHVILGLPGESEEDMLETARFLSKLDIQAVKIHLLYVVRGTVLERWYAEGKYHCLSREDYVRIVSRFLALLPPHVIIQRLTGDPHREELVAPIWALEKQETLQAITSYMASHGIIQGSLFQQNI
ncbi:MAG: TIGR01212 family radical SAM protein [Syntrophobacterales bacterium]|nr:TIGR01212 family radical SAM protein [Syntrophobacterales bacterium]